MKLEGATAPSREHEGSTYRFQRAVSSSLRPGASGVCGRLTPVLALVVLAFAVSACASTDVPPDDTAEPRTIEVSMTDELRFEPDEFTVAPGETIRFEVTNVGQTAHEFLLGDEAAQAEFEEEMGGGETDHGSHSGVSVEPGQTETFDYTFGAEPGEILAGCHEPGHYDAGMVATVRIGQ